MKRLILTGDDFGLSVPVNVAIERAYQNGILTTASLMLSGAALGDAIERARRHPGLKIGLHITLVCGRPVLPSADVPGLADGNGNLPSTCSERGSVSSSDPRCAGSWKRRFARSSPPSGPPGCTWIT